LSPGSNKRRATRPTDISAIQTRTAAKALGTLTGAASLLQAIHVDLGALSLKESAQACRCAGAHTNEGLGEVMSTAGGAFGHRLQQFISQRLLESDLRLNGPFDFFLLCFVGVDRAKRIEHVSELMQLILQLTFLGFHFLRSLSGSLRGHRIWSEVWLGARMWLEPSFRVRRHGFQGHRGLSLQGHRGLSLSLHRICVYRI
jgi:hypothetical protein